jgi:hypothetical protein
MFDKDADVTPVVNEANTLPNKTVNFDDGNDEESFVYLASEMLESTNQEFKDYNEIIPALMQNQCSGEPRASRSLEKFYSPNPQDKW